MWALGAMHSLLVTLFRAVGYSDDRAEEAATWLVALVFITAVWIVSQVLRYG